MASSHVSIPRRVAVGGLLGFFLLGVLAALLGPLLPLLRQTFGLTTSGASLLSAYFAGAVGGVLLAGVLEARLGPRERLALPVLTLGLGCLGFALAPSWPLVVGAAAVIGLGFGALDLTLNVLFSTGYGERSAFVLNLLSAAFGVGAILGPVVVSLSAEDVRLPLLACAGFAALLLPLFLSVRNAAPTAPSRARGARSTYPPRLWGFVGLLLVYVGLEAGISAWEPTHLEAALLITPAAAARLTALFWVGFTAGRLLAAPLALRVRPPSLATGALLLSASSLCLAVYAPAAPVAYALAGFFIAPVFPAGIVWLTNSLPVGGGGTALVFAGALFGPVVFSPLVGGLYDTFGARAIPVTLVGIALLNAAIAFGLGRTQQT